MRGADVMTGLNDVLSLLFLFIFLYYYYSFSVRNQKKLTTSGRTSFFFLNSIRLPLKGKIIKAALL